MISTSQQKVDQESFDKGWEDAFGGSKVVESSGHATKVPTETVRELHAKLARIKAYLLKIKDSDTASVQDLLAMFEE